MRQSFILHLDSLEILEEMTLEQKGILFDAIYNFQKGKEVILDFSMKMAFAPFINQFKRDDEKYKETVEKRKLAGAKGGTQKQANVASATISYQEIANVADSVSVNDSVNDNDNEEKERGEFSKNEIPTHSQSEIDLRIEVENLRNENLLLKSTPKKTKKESLPKRNLSEMCRDFLNANPEKYLTIMYTEFFNYWTEKDEKGKERWQNEKYFEVGKRLAKWQSNAITFNQNKQHVTGSAISNQRNNGFNPSIPRVIAQYVYDNSKD